MKPHLYCCVLTFVLLASQNLFAQSAKAFYKNAEANINTKNYAEVIESCTQAIKLDSSLVQAYELRGQAYENIFKYIKAARDYELAATLKPKESSYFLKAAELYLLMHQGEKALNLANQVLEYDDKNLSAYNAKVKILISLNQLEKATQAADKALDIKKTYQSYYNKGWVSFLNQDFDEANDYFLKARAKDKNQVVVVIRLSENCFAQNKLSDAMDFANEAIAMDEHNKEAFLIRAKIYHKKVEHQNAIKDLSHIIKLYPKDVDINQIYYLRASYYFEFNQQILAIQDFTTIIESPRPMLEAYFMRATAYEYTHRYREAIADYEAIMKKEGTSLVTEELLKKTEKRLFELKRERNKPKLKITSPVVHSAGVLEVLQGEKLVKIEGELLDESKIKSFEVNGNRVLFETENEKNTFTTYVNVAHKTAFHTRLIDVYDNISEERYLIVFTENDPPKITLLAPNTLSNGLLKIDSIPNHIYIQGKINDESQIKSILINGIPANFISNMHNPKFEAHIDLTNQNKITIMAEDIFGNKAIREYIVSH
jgi:tetratricopeptide (TPR) repeat protein